MAKHLNGIYGGKDPRDIAAYTVAEAARYIHMPPQTLRAWIAGQSYGQHSNRPPFIPLVTAPEYNPLRLSFNNLIEAYTLRALRTKHGVSIHAAREAIEVAEQAFNIQRLFVHPQQLRTDAGELFLEKYGALINLRKPGQNLLFQFFRECLKRIEIDDQLLPFRLYPGPDKKTVMIDPTISFGRPVVSGRCISTAAIVDRLGSGESVQDVAEDYKLSEDQMSDAITYELAA